MNDPLFRWRSYFYPGTDVLINKPGLRDQEDLKLFEYRAVAAREVTLPVDVKYGDFSLAHLQSIHRYLFQDVYEWAGQQRDVSMSKGRSSIFVRPELLPDEAERIHDRLKRANLLCGLDRSSFVDGLASLYADLNRMHPFREGNGRSTRVLLSALAENAGFCLDQRRIENDKYQWNSAAARSMGGDTSELRRIFLEAVRPMRAVAMERMSPERAAILHPELQPLLNGLAIFERTLAAQYPDNSRAREHFLAAKRTELVRSLDSGSVKGLAMSAARNGPLKRCEYTMLKSLELAEKAIPVHADRMSYVRAVQQRIRSRDTDPTRSLSTHSH